ncbi:MAG: M23 family metallopeptidase [Endomicrobiales bacterium]|jgi:murein DD-endopeptidase MepM/ murein hydrolase activator NlpD
MITRILKRELSRKLTIMLIPHNSIKPLRISFSASLLLMIIFLWSGLTISAGYLYSEHIDYWRIKADHNIMKLKVTFFAKEIEKSQEMLEQVKENDQQIRSLLGMKSKKAIIENEGQGGPSKEDTQDLHLLLTDTVHEMTQADIARKTAALQDETRKRIDSYKEICSTIHGERSQFHCTPNIWPCQGHITSGFGYRVHPIYETSEFHSGLDIANAQGTPIYATADGMVKLAEWTSGYGRLVVIDHGYSYCTLYGHTEKMIVTKGERVHRGQLIAYMGSTGASTGSHLHYEVQFKGSPVNPAHYLTNNGGENFRKYI